MTDNFFTLAQVLPGITKEEGFVTYTGVYHQGATLGSSTILRDTFGVCQNDCLGSPGMTPGSTTEIPNSLNFFRFLLAENPSK